ncbi:hypothetical protein [Streptomyces sp. NPDC092952]|uniref:hypothetical protein n=1 Tax=Streptomyces sp. NPDC092952 TaxID=3366018 RepID=UPI003802F2DB
MRRALVHSIAWVLSTGAAVTLSWWGVHTAMTGTAYDPPRAVPIAEAERASNNLPEPGKTPSQRPGKSPEPTRSEPGGVRRDGSAGSPWPDAARTPTRPPSPDPSRTAPGGSANVKGYTVDGGRVVFDIKRASAELVSATPESGWQMQVWKTAQWIRVTFTQGDREISVFCTWYQHAPLVEIEGQ